MASGLLAKIPERLLTSIQQAANEPLTWQETLAQITDWVGGDVGSLLAHRRKPEPETTLVACGIEHEDHPAHPRHHGRRAPYSTHAARLPVGRAMLLRELLQAKKRNYRVELCHAQNLTDLQGMVLFRDAHWRVSLSTFSRAEGRFDERTRARLEAVGHHVHTALLLGRRYEAIGGEASLGLRLARDMGLVRTLLVDARLRVLEGHEQWQESNRSRSSSQRASKIQPSLDIERRLLSAGASQDQARLRQAVEQAVRGKTSVLTMQTGTEPALVGLVPGPWLSPLSAERTASLILPPVLTRLARADLTRTQALPKALREVAEHLVSGRTDKEIAISMGLSLSSARTYVARTMKRLGVNNRRELMRLQRG